MRDANREREEIIKVATLNKQAIIGEGEYRKEEILTEAERLK